MSWTTTKAVLVSALEDLGYTEVPGNQDVDELGSIEHNCFTARGIGLNEIPVTGLTAVTYVVELKFGYVGVNNADYDNNFNSFADLALEIAGLNGFLGWVDATFEQNEETKQKQIGTFNLIYGIGGC